MTEIQQPQQRGIRSFVRREGRVTKSQQLALESLWADYVIELGDQPLDLMQVFGREAPTVVEIGFGHGENLWQLAARHPEKNFIGIEVYRAGMGALMAQCHQHQLKNVRIICDDAVDVFSRYLLDAVLEGIWIFFPDPWHKKRHHKRRLIQTEFVDQISRKLIPNGILHLATDWQDYAEHMLAVLDANSNYINLSGHGSYAKRPSSRVESKFERRGMRLGHGVWDLLYMKG